MDYLAAIGWVAALPARVIWRLIAGPEEKFEYVSRTSRDD